MDNIRKQILYQKTEFNNYKICQMTNIFKCCKCKKNNTIIEKREIQNCLFCGMPNFCKKC